MADYTLTAGVSMTGNGTNLTPERWMKGLQMALPVYNTWRQFTTEAVDAERIVAAKGGDTIRLNYFNQINVSTTALTEGTFTPLGTMDSSQVSVSVSEYGNKIDMSGLQVWMTPSNVPETTYEAITANAVQTIDKVIGGVYVAATNYFSVYGTDAMYENAHTGTRGTQYVYPTHVRQIRARLARLGVEPFVIGGRPLYVWAAPPGAFEVFQGQSEFADNAARLQEAGAFTTGMVGVYGGFAFVEDMGANASTTYSNTVGTSVVFGRDACVGGATLGGDGFIWLYPDVHNDGGRTARVLWNAKAGYSLSIQGTTNARTWVVYHKM